MKNERNSVKPKLDHLRRQEWLQCLRAAATVVGRLTVIYPENLTTVVSIADQFYEMLEERRASPRGAK